MNVLTHYLWVAYLGIAPIYWLPGVAVVELFWAKLGLIGLATIVTWWTAVHRGHVRFPPGILGVGGYCAVLLVSLFGFYQTDQANLLRKFLDLTLGFVMMWTMYVYAWDSQRILRLLAHSSIVIGVACALVTSSMLTGFPGWTSPEQFGGYPLVEGGFHAKRTGWSNGVALFIAPLFFWVIDRKNAGWFKVGLIFFLILAIVGSQVSVGGRAGILTSGVILAGISFFVLPRQWFVALSISGIILVIISGAFLIEHLRLDRLDSSGSSYDVINSFSAGRVAGFSHALEQIAANPVTGLGFFKGTFLGVEHHNLWLKLAAEAGVFLPLLFAYIVFRILMLMRADFRQKAGRRGDKKMYERLKIYGQTKFILASLILGSVIISMFEPRALLGSFQNSAIWWAAAGAMLAVSKDKSIDMDLNEESVGREEKKKIQFVSKRSSNRKV